MIRLAVLLLATASALVVPLRAADPAAEVTYIANEGFLIEIQGKKVLVDALFYGETIDWCDVPSAAVREQMEAARGPFAGVDLVLVTHSHTDHFNPEVVLKHLASNPEATVVGPPQAISMLRALPDWTEKLADRVKEPDLDLFGSKRLLLGGIDLQVHRIRHGAYPITDEKTGEKRNKHEEVENLFYLVEIGGVRFAHLGDAFLGENQEYFDGKRFTKQRIDLVFLEGWTEESLEILRTWMEPRQVIFMHMPADEDRTGKIAQYVSTLVPGSFVFRKPMETRSFPAE